MKAYKPPRKTFHVAPLPKATGATNPTPTPTGTLSLSGPAQAAPVAPQSPTLGWIKMANYPPVRLVHPTTTGSLTVPVGSLEIRVPFLSRFKRSASNKHGVRFTYVLTPWGQIHAYIVFKDEVVEVEIPAWVLPTVKTVYFGVIK